MTPEGQIEEFDADLQPVKDLNDKSNEMFNVNLANMPQFANSTRGLMLIHVK
jgi:hypothetical protein